MEEIDNYPFEKFLIIEQKSKKITKCFQRIKFGTKEY